MTVVEIIGLVVLAHVYAGIGVVVGKFLYRPEYNKNSPDAVPASLGAIVWPGVISVLILIWWSKICFIAIPKWYLDGIALARDNITRQPPEIPIARTRRKNV